jgi:hypothetical protein
VPIDPLSILDRAASERIVVHTARLDRLKSEAYSTLDRFTSDDYVTSFGSNCQQQASGYIRARLPVWNENVCVITQLLELLALFPSANRSLLPATYSKLLLALLALPSRSSIDPQTYGPDLITR